MRGGGERPQQRGGGGLPGELTRRKKKVKDVESQVKENGFLGLGRGA